MTIRDVAQRAGVSTATVSRVLNGHGSVDEALAARVTDAVGQLGYRRNGLARNLRRQATSLWAVVVPDVENPFFTSIVRGVEDVAWNEGYSVVLCNSDEDPAKEARYVSAVVTEHMAGMIIAPAADRTGSIADVVASGRPVVTIDRVVEGVTADAVLVDNEEGAFNVTRHLIEEGYHRIACITGPRRLSTAKQRLRGYQQAMRDAGREPSQALVRHADFRERGGFDAMATLLDSREAPDAVFAANNLMTVGVLHCLAARQLVVPDDVAVAGFDPVPWADLVRPSITSVRQPTHDVGQAAGRLLAERIRRPGTAPTTVVLRTVLEVRDSSRRRGGTTGQ